MFNVKALVNKRNIIILIIAVCIVISGIVIYYNRGKSKLSESSTDRNVIAVIKYNKDTIKLKYNNNKIDEYINDKYKCSFEKECNKKDILRLADDSTANDLDKKSLIASNTYKSDLNNSTRYINFLKSNKYKEVYQARTYKFIELYMTKDNKSYKRIIITKDFIIEYDLNSIDNLNNINVQDYIIK